MGKISNSTLGLCKAALASALTRASPGTVLDEAGYVGQVGQNLISGVHLRDFEEDFRQGNGQELEAKMRAAHSSSALAVNTFAPFKHNPGDLSLGTASPSSRLVFERKCPNGMGTAPPNLDALVEGESGTVAIESSVSSR